MHYKLIFYNMYNVQFSDSELISVLFITFHFLEAFLLNFHDLKFHLHSHNYHLDQHHLEPEKKIII